MADAQEDATPMQAPQLVLEKSPTSHRLIVAAIPTSRGPWSGEPVRFRTVTLPITDKPPILRAALARLRVFWAKYRWYRNHGYPRAFAREKAWWHAREAPCPLLASAQPE